MRPRRYWAVDNFYSISNLFNIRSYNKEFPHFLMSHVAFISSDIILFKLTIAALAQGDDLSVEKRWVAPPLQLS